MSRSPEEIAAVRSRLDAIVVDNPRARQAHQVFDFLMAHGRAQGREPKRCVLLVGPSQSGKSTILKPYVARRNTPHALERGEIPVLFVELRPAITTKGLAQTLLEAIARHGYTTGPTSGSESVLLARVDRLLEAAKVQLLVLDEFHHIQNIESRKTAWLVAETIKLFLIQGQCPVVLSGIEQAKTPFLENRQLSQRAEPPIELHPLSALKREDRLLFAGFLKAYLLSAEVRAEGEEHRLRASKPRGVLALADDAAFELLEPENPERDATLGARYLAVTLCNMAVVAHEKANRPDPAADEAIQAVLNGYVDWYAQSD